MKFITLIHNNFLRLYCFRSLLQQTISLLMVIKSSYTAAMASVYMTVVYLVLGSATVRSLASLPEFLEHLTYVTQARYTGAILNNVEFYNKTSLTSLRWINATTGKTSVCQSSQFEFGCRYTLLLSSSHTHTFLETPAQ